MLYNEIHDPEGVLSTLPAIVTAMIGIFTGEYLLKKGVYGYKKVVVMLLFSLLLLFLGALRLLPEEYCDLGYWCCYMLLCWLFLYLLYRKKIFLKV